MKPPTSDKMLQLALKHPSGSEKRRSYIEAALKLERRPRGRPKGTDGPHKPGPPAILLMLRIALETGERGAERLARLAIDTKLLDEHAENASRRLARIWRTFRQIIDLEAMAAGLEAAGRRVRDSDTVARQVGEDPYWRDLIMRGERRSAPTHWLDLVLDQIGSRPILAQEPKK